MASTHIHHPNRLPFEGVLTFADIPSDKAPSGARGHRVILTKKATKAALPSLLGMAVAYKVGWDGHDPRQKCGVITAAKLVSGKVCVSGHLFDRDFPEIARKLRDSPEPMGMSYELADAHIEDMSLNVWTITKATFTGAAILLQEKAAYQGTSFSLLSQGVTKGKKLRGAQINAVEEEQDERSTSTTESSSGEEQGSACDGAGIDIDYIADKHDLF